MDSTDGQDLPNRVALGDESLESPKSSTGSPSIVDRKSSDPGDAVDDDARKLIYSSREAVENTQSNGSEPAGQAADARAHDDDDDDERTINSWSTPSKPVAVNGFKKWKQPGPVSRIR